MTERQSQAEDGWKGPLYKAVTLRSLRDNKESETRHPSTCRVCACHPRRTIGFQKRANPPGVQRGQIHRLVLTYFRLEMHSSLAHGRPRFWQESVRRPWGIAYYSVLRTSFSLHYPLALTTESWRDFLCSKGRINEKATGKKETGTLFLFGTTPLSIGSCLWRVYGLSLPPSPRPL